LIRGCRDGTAPRMRASVLGNRMTDRFALRFRRVLASLCCLAWAMASLTGATGSSGSAGSTVTAIKPAFRVLQLNLCDSGIAACYTGRSVSAAAALIRNLRPDIVTLNEVCGDDVSGLKATMTAVHSDLLVASAFKAAVDRPTNGPFRCRNGQPYGVGVLALLRPSTTGYGTYGDRYPMQDLADPEERVWVCIRAEGFDACTTHTASTSTALAFAQCRYLLYQALPTLLSRTGDALVVLGADLNLPSGRSGGAQSCVGDGYHRADDGSRQDIVTSSGLAAAHRSIIDMHGTTDHPALFVEFIRARR
jgi:hypothetical protein